MRITLDTNVLVSGLLSPFGAPGEVVRLVASEAVLLCYDARIIAEYECVLKRPKFKFDPRLVDVLLESIESAGLLVAAEPLPKPLPDRDDEPFLAVALAAGAQFLVTGNVKHFSGAQARTLRAVSPQEFIAHYRQTISRKPRRKQ